MKLFENVKVGDEVEFLNTENKLETGLVISVKNKKFSVKTLYRSESENSWYEFTMTWFLSGKKTNRYYNYGNATRIVNKS